MDDEDSVLTPGNAIRPELDENKVKDFVLDLYGLKITEVKELNSYDDRNFWIRVVQSNNSGISDISNDGYVFKVLNSLDSKYTEAMEAQNEMILLVHADGVPTPRPVTNLNNELMSVIHLSPPERSDEADRKRKYIARLFEYIPGRILHGVPYTSRLMYDIGKLAGRIDYICKIKNFNPPAYGKHKRIWSLTEVPKLEKFLDCLPDIDKRKLTESVIRVFREEVVTKYDRLQKGVIHGDFNEQNILIRKCEDSEEFELTAILDFGDSTSSFYVFEIGVLIMYMMIVSETMDPFETAGHALAGYLTEFDLCPFDLGVLKECIAGRFAQSLVMGTYSSAMDPDNSEYLLITAPKGWSLLRQVWDMPKPDMYGKFQQILRNYDLHTTFSY